MPPSSQVGSPPFLRNSFSCKATCKREGQREEREGGREGGEKGGKREGDSERERERERETRPQGQEDTHIFNISNKQTEPFQQPRDHLIWKQLARARHDVRDLPPTHPRPSPYLHAAAYCFPNPQAVNFLTAMSDSTLSTPHNRIHYVRTSLAIKSHFITYQVSTSVSAGSLGRVRRRGERKGGGGRERESGACSLGNLIILSTTKSLLY